MLDVTRLDSSALDFDDRLTRLLDRGGEADRSVAETVEKILRDVREHGDRAVLDYTRRFDAIEADSVATLEVSSDRLQAALVGLDHELRSALETAARRLQAYAEQQRMTSWRFTDEYGDELGQRVTALDRVGIYVPGGKASYPSSVLMNAIPARVAGVSEVVMVAPAPRGEINPLVLAAAAVAGVDRVFTIGGAQAVGALAYGTQTIPAVDKIVGPGNAFVAQAKRQVFGTVGIDMIAGPSEILIICDGQTDPDWVAMDLFSQAEHDEDAQAILVSPDRAFLDTVAQRMAVLVAELPRESIVRASVRDHGALIAVDNLDQAAAVANRVAPEHLELSVADPDALLDKIRHAGAVFMGRYTPEAFGDYCAGPNHVLPTGGTARFSSPLGVYDFQKRTSIIQTRAAGARALAPVAERLANGEGLQAHARSAAMRSEVSE